jgi:hypothetical protein
MNWPSKLEHYIVLGLKGFSWTSLFAAFISYEENGSVANMGNLPSISYTSIFK